MEAIETDAALTIARNFERDGFAVAEDLADASTLATLREVYDGMLDGSVACRGTDRALGGLTRQIMNPDRHHPLFAANAALERARELAKRLVKCEAPQFVYSMLIFKPPGHPHITPWHQDMSYAGRPFTRAGALWPVDAFVQFWLALDDVDETMGCMEYIPGVQHEPMPPHIVVGGDPDDDGRLLAIDAPERRLDLTKAVKCPVRAGSASLHGYATPHFTGPNRSTRGRRAYIFNFSNPERLASIRRPAKGD